MAKVLVVDESQDVRTLLGEAIGKGVEILAATTGAQAVECIEHDRPDLVVCDVYMPDMDGYRICDFVRTHPELRATPVVLMADTVDRAVLARAARVGSDNVVRKPFPVEELLGRIASFLPDVASQRAVEPRDVQLEPDAPSDAKAVLTLLAELPGVSFAALMDREGFVIEWAGETALGAEMVAALVSCLGQSSEGIGRELGQGALRSMICEYDEGLVLLMGADPTSSLALVLRDPAALEAARRSAREVAPALVQALYPARQFA